MNVEKDAKRYKDYTVSNSLIVVLRVTKEAINVTLFNRAQNMYYNLEDIFREMPKI